MLNRKRPKGDAWRGFPERLVRARTIRNLSQRELADRARVWPSLLSRLENQERPWVAAETLLRLSKALSVRPEWLWHGAGSMVGLSAHCPMTDRVVEACDPEIAATIDAAISLAARAYHETAVAVARAFAADGERHTDSGWLARLDEIEGLLAPLVGPKP